MTLGRTLRLVLLASIAIANGAQGAEPSVQATAVRVSGGTTSVRMVNNATGSSAWINVGQTFGGYVIASFEAASNTVVLSRDGTNMRLQLRSPRVQNSRGQTPSAPQQDPAGVAARGEGPMPAPEAPTASDTPAPPAQ
jgi:hypothetical protein